MSRVVEEPRYASIETAASYACVCRATIYKLLNKGEIISTRVGTRRLIDMGSLNAYLDRHRDDRPLAGAEVPEV